MKKFKVIKVWSGSEKDLKNLEEFLNNGWEIYNSTPLYHTASSHISGSIIYVLVKTENKENKENK